MCDDALRVQVPPLFRLASAPTVLRVFSLVLGRSTVCRVASMDAGILLKGVS